MKICIIGGSGFVGSRLLSLFKDFDLLNIDKNPSIQNQKITLIHNICESLIDIGSLKGTDVIIHLAAEHTDNVSPKSLYYDVNVNGTKNIIAAAEKYNIKKIIFTSSVAVYGLNKECPDEYSIPDPFNHYGKSKLEAEKLLVDWLRKDELNRTLILIRPTVIFGERNRGNFYNLLKQIVNGKFLMVGNGNNTKSMSYVGNIAAFIDYCCQHINNGLYLYNYVDKPDLTTNELVLKIENITGKKLSKIRIPYFVGYCAGLFFDIISKIFSTKFNISSVRIKKFCATTQFCSSNIRSTSFNAPFSIDESLKKTIEFEFFKK